MKISLQFSNYSLQETVLQTLSEISTLQEELITVNVIKLLLYFIMIPTSKHSLLAVNIFIKMAKNYEEHGTILFQMYHQSIFKEIVELCAINQSLINYNLSNSLETISLVLGFFGTKDFITKQCDFLLPFFVVLVVKIPAVTTLIEEIATLVELELGELLATKYGNIFLHIFLNENDEIFEKTMKYLEDNTGLSGPVLRKRNFKILLNELLLNFSENYNRVILALKHLAQEDADGQEISFEQIPDYLQPRFLGVLQYFDTKLISKDFQKEKVLLSLAQMFKIMGPKKIAPLRFKVIAMLRTALNFNYSDFPELNCDIWNTFVRTCDIEVLGPQLATIFVSLLPLLNQNPVKINGIFKYLVVDNEAAMKDNIPDLFFILETNIDSDILLVIKKNMKIFEENSFKEQLKTFMKYLTHETIDIRIHGSKFLKKILEKNREELDQMILGYNGIDSVIVDLLDVLTLGCREKDENLKLACGDCIGELGAIEPSHLPRRYMR